jgi:hypothetical protein
MAINEIINGCGLSTEAVLPLNRKRRRVKNSNHNGQPEISAVCNRYVVKQKRRDRTADPAHVGDRAPPTEFIPNDPGQQVE